VGARKGEGAQPEPIGMVIRKAAVFRTIVICFRYRREMESMRKNKPFQGHRINFCYRREI
jgi:hypothetical protein